MVLLHGVCAWFLGRVSRQAIYARRVVSHFSIHLCLRLMYVHVCHVTLHHFTYIIHMSHFLPLYACQMARKRSRPSSQPASGSTSYSRSRFISATTQEVFTSQFSLRPVLMEREVILSDLPVEIAAILVSRGWEPLLVGLSPPPTLLVQEFYANINDIDGSSFRFFLRGHTFRVTPSALAKALGIPEITHPTYPYILPSSVPADSLVRSTILNTPSVGGPTAMATGSLPTDRQVLLRIVCMNLWPVAHTSSLPMGRARFLYALLRGDSIDLPSFICQQILASFRTPGGRIGLPYACLIHRVTLALGASFPESSTRRIGRPIGQQTIHQSRSHIPASSSSAPTADAVFDVFDSSEPLDPIFDILTGGSRVCLPSRSTPPLAIPISSSGPSASTSVPGWLHCQLTPWCLFWVR